MKWGRIVAIHSIPGAMPMDVRQLEDPALINLIVQREESALSELYDRYSRLVFSLALQIIGDQGAAEEITLDVFNRVWEKGHTYQADMAKVSTWITRMARNRAIDALRHEESRPLKQSLSWAELPFEPEGSDDNPEASTQLAIEQRRVREAVAALPADQQEVLALAYFRGLSHSEIAHLLDQPLGTVKGRIRAGMQRLRLLLQNVQPGS